MPFNAALKQGAVGFGSRGHHEWQLEELIAGLQHQGVGIQNHQALKVRQGEGGELCEGAV